MHNGPLSTRRGKANIFANILAVSTSSLDLHISAKITQNLHISAKIAQFLLQAAANIHKCDSRDPQIKIKDHSCYQIQSKYLDPT